MLNRFANGSTSAPAQAVLTASGVIKAVCLSVMLLVLNACSLLQPAPEVVDQGPAEKPLPPALVERYNEGLELLQDSAEQQSAEQDQESEAEAFQTVFDHWQTLSQEYPDYPGVWVNLALVQYRMHEYQASLDSVSSAQALQPDFCPAFKLKGLVQRELGDFSGAEASYLAAMACAPQDADIPYNLGILYDLYIGDLEKALAQYQHSRTLRAQEDAMLAIWIPDLQRRTGIDPEAAAVATASDAETAELQTPPASDEDVTETVQPQVAGE